MRLTADQLDEIVLVLSNEGGMHSSYTSGRSRVARERLVCSWADTRLKRLREPYKHYLEDADVNLITDRLDEQWGLVAAPKSDLRATAPKKAPLLPDFWPLDHQLLGALQRNLGTVNISANNVSHRELKGKDGKVVAAFKPGLYNDLYVELNKVHAELNKVHAGMNPGYWRRLAWLLLVFHADKLTWWVEPKFSDGDLSYPGAAEAERRLGKVSPEADLSALGVRTQLHSQEVDRIIRDAEGFMANGTTTGRSVKNYGVQAQSSNDLAAQFLKLSQSSETMNPDNAGVHLTNTPDRLASETGSTSSAISQTISESNTMSKIIAIRTVTTVSTDKEENSVTTFVNGTDIKNLSNAQIYGLISDAEELVATLGKIQNKPLQLVAEIAAHREGINALVRHLDERYLAENPDASAAKPKAKAKASKVTQAPATPKVGDSPEGGEQ